MGSRDQPRRQSPAPRTENVEGNGLLFVAEHTQAVPRSQVRIPKPAAIRARHTDRGASGRDNPAVDRRIERTWLVRDEALPERRSARSPSRPNEANPKSLPLTLCSLGTRALADRGHAYRVVPESRIESPRGIAAPRSLHLLPVEKPAPGARPESSQGSAVTVVPKPPSIPP